jgi:histidine ammonia-lyase
VESAIRGAAEGTLNAPPAPQPQTVTIDAEPLALEELVRVAGGAQLQLGPAAQARIHESRAVVDRWVNGAELIYGLNTGLGHMRDVRMPVEALRASQPAIVALHAGAIGPGLPTSVVRAAMAVRVAGIARGGSGASHAVAEILVAMLNAGVHPLVPTVGSVGASDLMHMAAIGLVAIGGGEAEYRDELLPGGEALRQAGLVPVELEPKDGLALVSANGVSIGHAALVAARAEQAADLADVVAAVSLEAVRGNISIVDPVVARAKPVPGQAISAARIHGLLAGSERCLAGAAASVQDPLSFRVMPQVHGALRETNRYLADQVRIELAAMDDNPLVDVEGGRLLSNGNFHPLAMALAADALRPAVAHVGQLSDRRLNHIWTLITSAADLTDADTLEEAADYGGLLMRYAAAARYAELRELAGPVTLDISPLDLAVEDHATNATLAARRSDDALDLLDDMFAIELLAAADILRLSGLQAGRSGAGASAVLAELDEVRRTVGPRAPSHVLHAAVRARLYDRLLPAADETLAR